MYELHVALKEAGINCVHDPANLVLVSAGYHATLHTDKYIKDVHDRIMSTDRSRAAIYKELFYLRIEIAANDRLGIGY